MASEFTASCLTTGQEFILDQLKPVVLAFRCGEGAQKLQAELDLFGPCPRPEVQILIVDEFRGFQSPEPDLPNYP